MKLKLLLSLCIIILFSISLVSAAEWDNCKEVSADSKEVKIKDKCLLGLDVPFVTNEIATIVLDTELNQHVGGGYGKVAQYTVYSKKDYVDAMRLIEFYDKTAAKDNKRSFLDYETTIEFDYKYFNGYKNITKNNYITVCEEGYFAYNPEDYNHCWSEANGTYIRTEEDWQTLTSKDFTKDENVTIGIFTYVSPGDSYEWIPTFAGEKVPQWASWTADLNIDLRQWFNLEETTGTVVEDATGQTNGTLGGTISRPGGDNGLIGNGYVFDGANGDSIDSNEAISSGDPYTISIWYNATYVSGAYSNLLAGIGYDSGGNTGQLNSYFTGNGITFYRDVTYKIETAWSIQAGQWYHVVAMQYANGTAQLYINGTLIAAQGWPLTLHGNIAVASLSSSQQSANGTVDMWGYWNRTLTQEEVTQLYNGGAGIEWTDDFSGDAPTVQLLTPDNNTLLYTNSTTDSINFQCNSSSPTGVTNLELFINDTSITSVANSSVAENLTINSNVDLPNGNFTWYCEGTNLEGATNSSIRHYKIRRLTIFLDHPENSYITEDYWIIINFTIEPSNTVLANVSLYIDGTLNSTNTSGTSGYYEYNITGLSFAAHTYSIQARDFNSTIYNNGTIAFLVSQLDIVLNSPSDNLITNNFSIAYDCNSSYSMGVLNMSLLINDTINYTIFNTTPTQDLSINTIVNLSDGYYNWTCEADSENLLSTAIHRYLIVDTLNPALNITAPPSVFVTLTGGESIYLNWSVSDDNLDSCWYEYGTELCYQESANISDQSGTDGDCGQAYTGAYKVGGLLWTDNGATLYDGSFLTWSLSMAGEFYINYTIPENATKYSKWRIATEYENTNLTINESCFYGDKLIFVANSFHNAGASYTRWSCYNSTSFITIHETLRASNGHTIYEEGMYWNISGTPVPCAAGTTSFDYIEGINSIMMFANDTAGNLNVTTASWTFYPLANLTNPEQYSNESTALINFECNVTQPDSVLINEAFLYVDGIFIGSDTVDAPFIFLNQSYTVVGDGLHNYTCFGENALGYNVTESYNFTLDTTAPTLNVTAPGTYFATLTNGDSLQLNWTVSDINLDICWYEYTAGSYVYVDCSLNTTTFSYITGNNNITFFANDTANNIANQTKTWAALIENQLHVYNNNTYETANETIIMNITYNNTAFPSLVGILYYNNTAYPGSTSYYGVNASLTAYVSVPQFDNDTNVSFYWTIGFYDGLNFTYANTTNATQLVLLYTATSCNDTTNQTALNFTTYDTADFLPINASFETTFSYSIGGGPGNNFSYESIDENKSNWMFCFDYNLNSTISGVASYFTTGYDRREYILTGAIAGNATEHIPLFLTATDVSDVVTITVIDENLDEVQGALIYVQNWDIGTDTYYTVGMFTTSNEGKGFINLILYDQWYRFIVIIDGEINVVTPNEKLAETTKTINVIIGGVNNYVLFNDISGDVTFDNTTNIASFIFADVTGYTQEGCLVIIETQLNGSTTYFEQCVESTAGIISTIIGKNGTFIAYGKILLTSTYDSIYQIIDTEYIQIGKRDSALLFGHFGQFISYLMIGVVAFIGIVAESILLGLGLIIAVLILISYMGWLNLTPTVFWGIIAIIIIIASRLARRRA